jgi:hypothetical protein
MVVIVVHAASQENWRESDVAEQARHRFGLPVAEVIVRKRRSRLPAQPRAVQTPPASMPCSHDRQFA